MWPCWPGASPRARSSKIHQRVLPRRFENLVLMFSRDLVLQSTSQLQEPRRYRHRHLQIDGIIHPLLLSLASIWRSSGQAIAFFHRQPSNCGERSMRRRRATPNVSARPRQFRPGRRVISDDTRRKMLYSGFYGFPCPRHWCSSLTALTAGVKPSWRWRSASSSPNTAGTRRRRYYDSLAGTWALPGNGP